LLTAGLGGFPVGDLGWFPTQYASWKAQESFELAHIDSVLTGKITVGVQTAAQSPQKFQLQQNYPNPFNPSTTIGYQLPAGSHVTIKVFDVLGREVVTLVNERQTAGEHSIVFDASHLPSGVYFNSITADAFHQVRKMVLVK
jgi:glucuronoarabinoxylan endo-1,4-beta-xylanase